MPLIATKGAASAQGFGEFAQSAAPNYIEQVFQTWLYTGNGSTQTITNGIDLSTKGGLVWAKRRDTTGNNVLMDSARGSNNFLISNSTGSEAAGSDVVFNSNGFSLTTSTLNTSAGTFASWTFRKQPKFFDVVTWTGDGNATKTISHNLGSTPGCIIVKLTSGVNGWDVYHRSLGTSAYVQLNTTAASTTISNVWGSITSTTFTATGTLGQNDSGATYVAYLFAHDAGGFGLTGSDNVISCGSFTTDGSENSTTNLGYEPQWLLLKATAGGTAGSQPWHIFDNMRGLTVAGRDDASLQPNNANAESQVNRIGITSTGFTTNAFGANTTFIYVAIRRGPMRTPTSGTSVFSPNAVTMTASGSATITTNFPVDLTLNRRRTSADGYVMDRLRGGTQTFYNFLVTQTTAAESSGSSIGVGFDNNTAVVDNNWLSGISANTIWWNFRRAPGFFDVVCYTGTGANRTVSHNLGVVPEMMIFKRRDTTANWRVYHSSQPASDLGILNSTSFFQTDTNVLNSTAPTASVFTVGTNAQTNASGGTYVAYLFATVAGVSKVGSYTGTGTTKQIDCGFTGGARFVLIKRVDNSGDWYVWDSARGIVAGNDPYLLLNSTAAEVTGTDYVDTYSAGFEISSTAPAAINANGGSFVFLAIA